MKRLLLLYVTVFFICSCSKDSDELKPTLVINSPTHLQEVNGVDTVQVIATVSDDKNIDFVSVSLRDENDIPVLSTITKTPNTKDYELNVLYFFDDIHLPSGQYDMRISASDGENTTTKYVQILLNETPINRSGTFVISNTGSVSDIYFLDNAFGGTFYTTVTGDYLGGAVNSFDQQLLHASSGSLPGANIHSINLQSGVGLWNIPISSSPPLPYYNSFMYENRTLYLGKDQGGVDGYGSNGVGSYNGSVLSGFQVGAMLLYDNVLVTEQQSVSSNAVQLIPYWLASGFPTNINATFTPGEDVLEMFTKTSSEIVVFSNDVGLNGNLTYTKLIS